MHLTSCNISSDKTTQQTRNRRKFPKANKVYLQGNGAIVFNSERVNAFPLRSRKEQDKDVLSPLLIHTV